MGRNKIFGAGSKRSNLTRKGLRKMENLAAIKKLVVAECANHQNRGPAGIKDYCWMREKSGRGGCSFFAGNDRCGYFEKSVLPLDPELEEEYENGRIEGGNSPDGEESGKSPGSVETGSLKTSIERLSLSQDRGEGILPGTGINGLASGKLRKSRRGGVGGYATARKRD
jgi:hypothetical protein